MKRWTILLLLLTVLLAAFPALAEDSLTLKAPDTVRGYALNTLTIVSDSEGELILRVADDNAVHFTCQQAKWEAGKNTIDWDGLSAYGERLPDGKYTLFAELRRDGKVIAETSTPIKIGKCKQALLYALPSSDTLYQAGDTKWFAEVCLVKSGAVVMEICPAGFPDAVLDKRRSNVSANPEKFSWDGKIDGKKAEPGEYLLRFYAKDNEKYVREITVTVSAEAAPVLPLAVTGKLLPEAGADDEAIWALMQQPAAVIDLKAESHQKVYAKPAKNSTVLGTLHGRSQAVEIMGLEEGWARIAAWNHESGAYMEGYVPEDCLLMVQPSGEYGLLLDKASQTLTVFHRGERGGTVSISTGLMAKNKLIRETSAGSFLTLEHTDAYTSDGFRYEYAIRYDGGNLLHQIGYPAGGSKKTFDEQTALLGRKATHGSVCLPRWSEGNDFNAYWLWTNIPYHTRLLILDDPEQRVLQEAAANAGRDFNPQTMTAAEAPGGLAADEMELVITLGGDAVLGTREAWKKKPEALPAVLKEQGMAYPFSGLQQIFADDDMTFINLECVLKANAAGELKDKEYRFRGLPSYTEALTLGSIEQVNIANNHYIDYGAKGKEATRAALTEAGMPFSGFGYTYVWEYEGRRIGFAGCRETTYKQDRDVIARDIASLREQNCDVIIYSCHWGKEYSASHNELQETIAKAASEAGADIVVGNHPHVVQGIDTVDGTLVLYSLGNLMFGGTHDMTTFDATLARLRLRFDPEGYRGCTVELIPILTSGSAPENDFRPIVAEGEDRLRILTKIQVDSSLLLGDVMWFPAK